MRVRRMVGIAELLKKHSAEVGGADSPYMAQLGGTRQVWATVVGPGLSVETEVRGVWNGTLVILVRSRPMVRTLESLEGFLLKTLAERVDGPPIRRVNYVVDPALGGTTPRRAGSGVRVLRPRVPRAVVQEVDRAVAAVPEGPLRDGARRWMLAVSAANEQKADAERAGDAAEEVT